MHVWVWVVSWPVHAGSRRASETRVEPVWLLRVGVGHRCRGGSVRLCGRLRWSWCCLSARGFLLVLFGSEKLGEESSLGLGLADRFFARLRDSFRFLVLEVLLDMSLEVPDGYTSLADRAFLSA